MTRVMSQFICWSAGCMAVIAMTGCEESRKVPEVSVPVYVTTVAKSEGVREQWFSARVGSRIESDIGFRVGGKVLKRLVSVGDRVREGQPLAMLDPTEYRLGVEGAHERYNAAQTAYRQSLSDARRFGRLSQEGSIPKAEDERQNSRSDAAEAAMNEARSAWELSQKRCDYTVLKAPYEGIIRTLSLEIAQTVAEGEPVVSIVKEGEREVVADLTEEAARSVARYRAEGVCWNGAADSMVLKLRELSPMARSPGLTYRARFDPVPSARGKLERMPLGSTLQLRLSRLDRDGVDLPASALIQTAHEPGVWAIRPDGKGLMWIKVRVLGYGNNTVRVEGVAEHTRVVTVGAQKLDGSMRVTPIERDRDAMETLAERGRA